jgi:hypothetical protein
MNAVNAKGHGVQTGFEIAILKKNSESLAPNA